MKKTVRKYLFFRFSFGNRYRLCVVLSLISWFPNSYSQCPLSNDSLLSYCINPKKQALQLFFADDQNHPLGNFKNLRNWLAAKGKKLVFAMNGGMYKTDQSPLGLHIDSGKTVNPLNTTSASGNFYLKPNGVFYITKNKTAAVVSTQKFKSGNQILYATQSGPMLVVDGKIHQAFTPGSTNLNIRNGVGILPNGEVLFVMSKKPINFYDFANFFKAAGCTNALYLDGFVSRSYLPAQHWEQLDENFGVMIGEVVDLK